MRRLLSSLVMVLAVAPACGGQDATTAPAVAAETTVLFVGNSLTYTHDLPGAFTTVARVLGHDVASVTVAFPNFALEDHWNQGIAGAIRQLRPDVVVLQQGPSSLPQNQAHLAAWSDSLARVAREVGAEPALLMVWPSTSRAFAFDDVRDAYRGAAEGVGGTFIPAGEALRVLADDDPTLDPFGPDGFHPGPTGTVAAAYVTVGALLEASVDGLPAALDAQPGGGRRVVLDEATARRLQAVADSVVAAWRE